MFVRLKISVCVVRFNSIVIKVTQSAASIETPVVVENDLQRDNSHRRGVN